MEQQHIIGMWASPSANTPPPQSFAGSASQADVASFHVWWLLCLTLLRRFRKIGVRLRETWDLLIGEVLFWILWELVPNREEQGKRSQKTEGWLRHIGQCLLGGNNCVSGLSMTIFSMRPGWVWPYSEKIQPKCLSMMIFSMRLRWVWPYSEKSA